MDHRSEVLRQLRDSHPDWWYFPPDGPVRGFLGTDPLFLVGDQPSTSDWTEDHPHRRAFYDPLARLDAGNAHITDLYKTRGKASELETRLLPEDFGEHVEFFRLELDILQPTRVVALGRLAYRLLAQHVPEIRPILTWMWSLGYVWRVGKLRYEQHLCQALLPGMTIIPDGELSRSMLRSRRPVRETGDLRKHGTGQRKLRYQLAEEILRGNGTDEEIQRRIMEEFPGSKENQTRAQWYRRSWNKYGHCRGDKKG